MLDNTTSGNGDAGIMMDSESTGVDEFRIIDNKVTSNLVGISTSSNSSNGSVWDNSVSGNGTNLSIDSSATSIE